MAKRKDKLLVIWDEESPGHIVIWTEWARALCDRVRRLAGVHSAYHSGNEMSAFFDPRYDPVQLKGQIVRLANQLESDDEQFVTCPTCGGTGQVPES